jgi:hydrogenase nickel incorporation protein HypA/HybF
MIPMHELSVMSQVVESVLGELKGKPVVRVKSVRLEIGELTMLGREQLRFAWGILTEEGPLKGAGLVIVRKPAVIECQKCGYRGGARHPAGLGSHMMMPYIACPKCGGQVSVVGGRDCVIRSMKAVVKDKKPPARKKGGRKIARH